ncbi:MAG: hypothetical protein HOD60_10230 [Candidatus Nitrosopelagicus sp.]|nr:hypothetical protein [Candidatus Nitrosopelagicus sp.]
MSFSELSLLDFKNILEWYDLLSEKSRDIPKYERSQEKIKGLFNIHEDRAEPLMDNLIAATLSDLEIHTSEELKSASSLLQNRKYRLEIKSKQIQDELYHRTASMKSEMNYLQFRLEEQEKEFEESMEMTENEIIKISHTLERIDEKLSGEKQ